MHCSPRSYLPTLFPRSFNSLNLSGGLYEYTSLNGNYSTVSEPPPRAFTGIYPGALSYLSAGDLSSDSIS